MPEQRQRSLNPKSFVFRAIFIANHPHLGRTVLCRTLFHRSVLGVVQRSSLDECGPKKSLYDTATRAIARTFPDHSVTFHTGKRFKRSGMTGKVINATVYHLDAPLPHSFLSLNDDSYIKLEEHPFSRDIIPAVKDVQLPATKLRLG